MKAHTKYEKIAMLWLNSSYVFTLSCWKGHFLLPLVVSWEHACHFLQCIFINLYDLIDLEAQSSQDISENCSVEIMVLWGNDHCQPKHQSQRISKNYLAFLSIGCSVPLGSMIIFGKSLSWKALFYWIDFKQYDTIMHTAFLVWLWSVVFPTMKCGVIYSAEKFCLTVLVILYEHHQTTILILLFKFFIPTSGHTFVYALYVYTVKLFSYSAMTYERKLQEETVSKVYLEKQWMALLDYNYKAIKHANNK